MLRRVATPGAATSGIYQRSENFSMRFIFPLLNASLSEVMPTPQGTGTIPTTVMVGTILGNIWGYLPSFIAVIGGIFAIVWYGIMIHESKTVKAWSDERAQARKLRRIAQLKAKEKIITAQLDALELKRSAAATAAELVRS